jgi:thiamine biosynthesis lipoprotein ApbE
MSMLHVEPKEPPVSAVAVERIVVQATLQEKKAIAAKAKRLGLPISELMRRGATAYHPAEADEELATLADAAKAAAERAAGSIDAALAFIAASNKRIAAMELKSSAARAPAKLRKAA